MTTQGRPIGVTIVAVFYGFSAFAASLQIPFYQHPLRALIVWLLYVGMVWGLFAMAPWGRGLALFWTGLAFIFTYRTLMAGTNSLARFLVGLTVLLVQATILFYFFRPKIVASFCRQA